MGGPIAQLSIGEAVVRDRPLREPTLISDPLKSPGFIFPEPQHKLKKVAVIPDSTECGVSLLYGRDLPPFTQRQ
jgi:hypothetical protein